MNGVTNSAHADIIVNGVTEVYTSLYTGKISANTFVQFVNDGEWSYSVGPQTVLADSVDRWNITAYALSDTKVLILSIADKGTGDRIYAVILTINDGLITTGTEVNISGSTAPVTVSPSFYIDADVISSTAFAVAYNVASGAKFHTYAVVCTVNNSTITAGTPTQITSTASDYGFAYVATLSSTSMIVVSYDTEYSCRLSGTSIVVVNNIALDEVSNITDGRDIIALSSSRAVYVQAGYDINGELYFNTDVIDVNSSQVASATSTVLITGFVTDYLDHVMRITPITAEKFVIFWDRYAKSVGLNGANAYSLWEDELTNEMRYVETLTSGSIATLSGVGILSAYTFQSSDNRLVLQSTEYLSPAVDNQCALTMLPTAYREVFFIEIDPNLGTMASILTPNYSGVIPYAEGEVFSFGVATNSAITNASVTVITV